MGRSAGSAKGKPKIEAYDKDRKKGAGALLAAAKVCVKFANNLQLLLLDFGCLLTTLHLSRHIILLPIPFLGKI